MNKLKFFCLSLLLGTVATFLLTFLNAFLDKSKSAFIYINNFHEANFEMFIVFPLVIFSCVYFIYDFVKEN